MSKYIIINKESGKITSLLDIDGTYLLDTTTTCSKAVPESTSMDFENFDYYFDTAVVGCIRKVERIKVAESGDFDVFLT